MNSKTIGDFLEQNGEITDFFVDNKCSECGQCCSNALPLSNHEINTIKAYIKRHGIKAQSQPVNVMAKRLVDFTCPFLDDSKPSHKCTIYEVRPQICRLFTCRKYSMQDIAKKLSDVQRRKCDVRQTFFEDKG